MVKQAKKSAWYYPSDPEVVQTRRNKGVTMDVDIDEFPSIERIPTAREFRSFDSSSDDSTAAAHRYEVDVSTLNDADEYDDTYDANGIVGVTEIVGVASEEESGAGPLWGNSEDEDNHSDWVADSFDHYDQRQVGDSKPKIRRKLWEKAKNLADEDDDFISESRTKQSVMTHSPKIFSPPSMKDYSYDESDEDEESNSLMDRRKKDIAKEVAAIAKRVHELEDAKDDDSMSTEEERNPSSERNHFKAPSDRRRLPISPRKEEPLEKNTRMSQKKRPKPAIPVPRVPSESSESADSAESNDPSERSDSPEPRDAPDSSGPAETRDLPQSIDSPKPTKHFFSEDPTSPSNTSKVSNFSDMAQIPPGAETDDGDQDSSRRSSKVGKLLSLPFKSKSSHKKDVLEESLSSPISQVSRGTSTHHQETIDLPTAQVVHTTAVRDATTNTSLPSVPKSPSSVSSRPDKRKSSKRKSLLKTFSFHASSKDDGELEEKDFAKRKSIPTVETSSTHMEDESTEKERKPPSRDAQVNTRNVHASDEVANTAKEQEEKSDSVAKAERKKKAARLIRSFIKSARMKPERAAADGERSVDDTAATSKRSRETEQEHTSKDVDLTKRDKNTTETIEAGDRETKPNEAKVAAETISNTDAGKTTNTEAKEKDSTNQDLKSKENENFLSSGIFGMLFGEPDDNETKEVPTEQPHETKAAEDAASVEPEKAVATAEKPTLEEEKFTPTEGPKSAEKKKSAKSRGIFGKVLGKPGSDEDKDARMEKAVVEESAPVKSITIPLKKAEEVPTETKPPLEETKEIATETKKDTVNVIEEKAAHPQKGSTVVATEQSLFDVGLDTKDIEEFLRENYCGPVADCLGLTQLAGEKPSVGGTNIAVKSQKLKLDGGEVDIDQAVAAIRKSKRMAKMPVKTIDVPQDYIFPSTSSITDSQAAYKEGMLKSKRNKSKTAKDDADQRKVKNFLHKMGARRPSKK